MNRLLEERAFNNINETTNQWNSSGAYSNRYFNDFTYDGSGNIVTQRRHNKAGSLVDSLNRVAKHVLTSAGEEESATFFKLEMQKLSYKVEKRHLMAINFKLR